MLNAESNRRERILDFVRHLARHLTPGEYAGSARQCRGIIEGDHAPVGRRAEQRELHANLPPVNFELAFLNRVSVPPRTSSDARGFAIVTRSPSSTAITPVATLASTRAVRCRASSSAAWLRRTSVAIRSKALRTGSNSRGVPGGKAGGSLPRPTAMAASRNAATGFPSRRAARPAR